MRPFFPFFGSKWNIIKHYPHPSDSIVIEPFAGSASYSVYHGVRKAILFDADPILAGLWDYLISVSEREILALPEMPIPGDHVDNYKIPTEAKWLIGFWLNRGSATPKKTRTGFSARIDKGQLNWGRRAKERIAINLPSIIDWEIQNKSYDAAPNISATWFIDPPYEQMGKHYRFHTVDYQALSSWCCSRYGNTIVCEASGANWLPFQPLGDFKSLRGRSGEMIFTKTRLD